MDNQSTVSHGFFWGENDKYLFLLCELDKLLLSSLKIVLVENTQAAKELFPYLELNDAITPEYAAISKLPGICKNCD